MGNYPPHNPRWRPWRVSNGWVRNLQIFELKVMRWSSHMKKPLVFAVVIWYLGWKVPKKYETIDRNEGRDAQRQQFGKVAKQGCSKFERWVVMFEMGSDGFMFLCANQVVVDLFPIPKSSNHHYKSGLLLRCPQLPAFAIWAVMKTREI